MISLKKDKYHFASVEAYACMCATKALCSCGGCGIGGCSSSCSSIGVPPGFPVLPKATQESFAFDNNANSIMSYSISSTVPWLSENGK